MGWARTAGIVLALALVATMPAVVAHAQTFYVTTSKAVYDEGERVVVAGTVSEAGDRRAVLVKLISDGDECARQNVRPMRDGSFISRPMTISGCSPSEFRVTATHANTTVSATFTVESKQEVDDSFELRAMRATVTEAQEVANARVREVLDANLAIPERAADAYSKGSAEAALTLQAIERGNAEVANQHREAALAYFRQALDLLSPDRLNAVAEDVREEQARVSAATEWFDRLQDMFRKLVDLAEKNGVAAEQEFGKIDEILVNARQLINERRAEGAEESLKAAGSLLEEARKKLVSQAEGDESQALLSAAERLEDTAKELRSEAADAPAARAKVIAAFIHIKSAKSSIADGDYDSAKASLDGALKKLEEARELLSRS